MNKKFNKIVIVSVVITLLTIIAIVILLCYRSPINIRIFNSYFMPYSVEISFRSSYYSDNGLERFIISYNSGDYQEAIKQADIILQRNTSNDMINFYLGIIYMQLEDFKNANEHLSNVSNNSSYKDPTIWYKALCSLRLKQYKDTKLLLHELIESDSYYKHQAQEIIRRIP